MWDDVLLSRRYGHSRFDWCVLLLCYSTVNSNYFKWKLGAVSKYEPYFSLSNKFFESAFPIFGDGWDVKGQGLGIYFRNSFFASLSIFHPIRPSRLHDTKRRGFPNCKSIDYHRQILSLVQPIAPSVVVQKLTSSVLRKSAVFLPSIAASPHLLTQKRREEKDTRQDGIHRQTASDAPELEGDGFVNRGLCCTYTPLTTTVSIIAATLRHTSSYHDSHYRQQS